MPGSFTNKTEHLALIIISLYEWEIISRSISGALRDTDKMTQNTTLHLLEAYTNLYRVWPEARMAERLRNIIELLLDKFIDPNTNHLHYVLDRYLNSTAEIENYGHDIEAAWLLRDAALLLGDKQLLKRVEDAVVKLAEAVEKAIQPDGSVIYEKNRATGRVNESRSWWTQAETIVGYFDAWEISGNEKFLDIAINCWNYTRDHFIDKTNGGWFTSVTPNGEVRGDKAGQWECPYHNSRMGMEIIERVERLQKRK